MNQNLKNAVYLVGIVAIVYFLIKYVLPIAIKMLGFFITIFLYVFIIGAAVVLVLYIVSYFVRKLNGE